MKEQNEILGKEVVDTETGMVGKVTAIAYYATGYKTVLLSGLDSTGRPIEHWAELSRIGNLEVAK
ncbi:hypothetical protein [Lactococcus petauri]|uniref:hypothetical protein n=1 Tax=Lactococcus petauri TaxID=1940789 RepID=UPI0030CBE847